jgi:hypothetical protein
LIFFYLRASNFFNNQKKKNSRTRINISCPPIFLFTTRKKDSIFMFSTTKALAPKSIGIVVVSLKCEIRSIFSFLYVQHLKYSSLFFLFCLLVLHKIVLINPENWCSLHQNCSIIHGRIQGGRQPASGLSHPRNNKPD